VRDICVRGQERMCFPK